MTSQHSGHSHQGHISFAAGVKADDGNIGSGPTNAPPHNRAAADPIPVPRRSRTRTSSSWGAEALGWDAPRFRTSAIARRHDDEVEAASVPAVN